MHAHTHTSLLISMVTTKDSSLKKKNRFSAGILFGDQNKQRTSRQSYYMFLLIKIQVCPAFQLILQKPLCLLKKKLPQYLFSLMQSLKTVFTFQKKGGSSLVVQGVRRCSQCRGPRFNYWSGNQIPYAPNKSSNAATKTWCSQNK